MEINNDKKLGRGLSALLGDASKSRETSKSNNVANTDADKNNNEAQSISVNNIIAGVYQPRKHFDHNQLVELSESIVHNGLIQPIVVRKADERGTFEIIAGERRFRAAKMAGLTTVPVIVKEVSNSQALEWAIIENVQREDLSVIEEAQGYKQLMAEFEYTQDQVAKKTGCSRSHIANILRLLSLPEEVQKMLDKKQLTLGHAKAIMNSDNIIEIAHQIVENGWTVRDVETMFKNENKVAVKSHSRKVGGNVKSKDPKSSAVKKIESKLSHLFPEHKVKAEFNPKKSNGKITIFFKDLAQISELINEL
jgi:ParB family chromosome partitioning protein